MLTFVLISMLAIMLVLVISGYVGSWVILGSLISRRLRPWLGNRLNKLVGFLVHPIIVFSMWRYTDSLALEDHRHAIQWTLGGLLVVLGIVSIRLLYHRKGMRSIALNTKAARWFPRLILHGAVFAALGPLFAQIVVWSIDGMAIWRLPNDHIIAFSFGFFMAYLVGFVPSLVCGVAVGAASLFNSRLRYLLLVGLGSGALASTIYLPLFYFHNIAQDNPAILLAALIFMLIIGGICGVLCTLCTIPLRGSDSSVNSTTDDLKAE